MRLVPFRESDESALTIDATVKVSRDITKKEISVLKAAIISSYGNKCCGGPDVELGGKKVTVVMDIDTHHVPWNHKYPILSEHLEFWLEGYLYGANSWANLSFEL